MKSTITAVIFTILMISTSFSQGKREMSLEDIMMFQSIGNTALSENGKWLAYEVKTERNDGYGMLVTTDGATEIKIERGERPLFSNDSRWAAFTVVPTFNEIEKRKPGEDPFNQLVLVNLSNGTRQVFVDVRQAAFSENSKFLFVHHHFTNDTTLSKTVNDKLKKAGTPFRLVSLDNLTEKQIGFVDSWTADSLSRNLVFIVSDTAKTNNGLYHLQLNVRGFPVQVADTTAGKKYGAFAWHQKTSVLAYMRAENQEKAKSETAELFSWKVGNDLPKLLATQSDAPEGLYLPFDNTFTWSDDGLRLFFGFRKAIYSSVEPEKKQYESVLDSIRSHAGVDIWHVNDPRIKTNEKASWNQSRRQNMIAVLYTFDNIIQLLADEKVPTVIPSKGSIYTAGFNPEPYLIKSTWDGNYRDFYGVNVNTNNKLLIVSELNDMASVSPTAHFALYFKNRNWHSYNLISGSTRYLTHNLGVPFYDEDHDTPGEPSSYRMMNWLDDGVSVILYDKYDIWLANLEFGTMTNITKGEGRKNQIIFRLKKLDSRPYSIKDDVLLEGFNEKTKERALYRTTFNKPDVRKLLDEGKNLKWIHASRDQKTFIYSRESYNEYPDLWSADSRFHNRIRLSNLSRQLDAYLWGTSELIEFENSDGVPLAGVLIKPGNYDPAKKYPVFVYYYEKSSQRLHEFNQTIINHRPSFGYYASNGYCVFLPDIHFEVGYPGMSAVKSLVPAVQKLIDMGVADKNAVGLHGHSWSGYQTAFVVTQTDLFKAAIAGAPVSNMTSAYSGIRWGTGLARQFQYERGQSRIGPSMFENLDLYLENSPVFFAEKIKTPLLLMHGDKDEAVPWEQSIEMYLAMRRLGKDVIFLQYRDEPHHPQKYPNKIDYTIRMKEYFDYHLKGMEPATWIKEGSPYSGK